MKLTIHVIAIVIIFTIMLIGIIRESFTQGYQKGRNLQPEFFFQGFVTNCPTCKKEQKLTIRSYDKLTITCGYCHAGELTVTGYHYETNTK